MAKKRKRVYEYAKDLGISSAELMHKLKFMGVRVANTFNAVEEDVIEEIKRQMGIHLFEEDVPVMPIKKKKKIVEEDLPIRKPKQDIPPRVEPEKKEAPVAPKPAPAPHAPEKPREPAAPAPQRPAEPRKEDRPQPQQPRKDDGKPSPKSDKDKDKKKKRKPVQDEEEEAIAAKKIKHGRKGRDAEENKDKKKKKKEADDYTSPSKRLEAIKKKGLQDRKGQKTTFLKKRSKKDKKKAREEGGEQALEMPQVRKAIKVSGPLSVKELSHEMGIKSSDVIMYLMKDLNLMTTLNQSLDLDVISLVCEHFGCAMEHQEIAPGTDADDIPIPVLDVGSDPANIIERPPVVTVMGHVDHGKTRLLDTIRKTNVIDTEHGGITQHIGAYQAEHDGKKITFLDTPGHAAFTQLRARGAKVTDLAVLVVAADDGVMPQTVEAIDHAREAHVPILVAVNKIDKPEAKPDRVRQQLSDKGLIPEEWGGDTVFVEISAKFNKNIEELLEMVFLVTDMAELKANPQRKAIGTVIEAKLDKGKGAVATVLVQNGTLKVGDHVVVGETVGRIRAMENDRAERVDEAGPSMPVEIIGLNSVPEAGDQLIVLEDEKTAKEIAGKRRTKSREEKLRYESRISLEDLFSRIQQEKLKEFKVVLKADVQGSLEAITSALSNITHEEVRVHVIRGGVGEIKETDIMLAAASNAVVMGYNVNILPAAQAMAQSEKVEVLFYEIIYQLTDQVRRAMAGLLAPEFDREYTGKVEVRTVFSSSKVGNIAGCYVTDGEMFSNSVIVVKRDGNEIYEGKIHSLKRFKDNVKSVKQGYECGVVLDGFNEVQEGDIIESYRLVERKRDTI